MERPTALVVDVESIILTIRGQRVILDSDLAGIYGVETKRLNEQMSRNVDRFPADFCFQLKKAEWQYLSALRSQTATLEKGRGSHRKYLPYCRYPSTDHEPD